MLCIVKLIMIISLIEKVKNANILFISPTASYSHSVVYFPIIRELSLRGHKVVTIIPDLINDRKLVNLTEIEIHEEAYRVVRRQLVTLMEQIVNDAPIMTNIKWLDNYSCSAVECIFQNSGVQKLIQHPHLYHFDIVITEWLTYQSTVAFAELFKCPLIGISSFALFLSGYDLIGNPTHPTYIPNLWFEVINPSSFLERLNSFINGIQYRHYYKHQMFPKQEALVKKYFGRRIHRSLREIENDVSIVLTNTNPILHGAYPKAVNLIEFGGIHEQQFKPLSQELKLFLDKAKNGFIYFSLGSNIKSYLLGEKTISIILKVFKDLPYSILWKFESKNLSDKPDNVFISQWFPQRAVLEHENIKIFLTQGGLQSVEEAVRAQVPLIITPFGGDQYELADRLQKLGIGKRLLLYDMTEKLLNDTIHEVINNKSYNRNMIEISNTLWDQPTKPLNRAVWWIEYVIRHKGAKFLRNPTLDDPWYQVELIDVYFFVFSILILILVITFCICKKLFNFIKFKVCR